MIKIKNVVKAAAASGETVRGVHLTFPAPTIIEVLARSAGLQFVYLDGEHGLFDWADIEAACIAAERCEVTPIARVADRSVSTITRFLDRGVLGIVAPHIETVEEAEEVVTATYFAPIGKRSFGSGRPEFGKELGNLREYVAECNARTCVCLMIESEAGLNNIAALARLEGVDYFSFGLMDLAQELGHVGDPTHPEVQQRVAAASEEIRAAGRRVREEFMNWCWVNDLIIAGALAKFGPSDK